MALELKTFFDKDTYTLTYILHDQETRDAIIIDPVLDFNFSAGTVDNKCFIEYSDYFQKESLNLKAVLETHIHADHLSCSQLLKQAYPEVKIGISARISEVQKTFAPTFGLDDLQANGEQFDILFHHNQDYKFGSIEVRSIQTPGHTPACLSFLIENYLFTGDLLFMPDFGTGRCDFPGGDPEQMYNSVKNLYSLPEHILIHTGHDYQPGGRPLKFSCSIEESKASNIHIKDNTSLDEFVAFRSNRDKQLSVPKLLYPALQINMTAGQLPEDGLLRIPLTRKY